MLLVEIELDAARQVKAGLSARLCVDIRRVHEHMDLEWREDGWVWV